MDRLVPWIAALTLVAAMAAPALVDPPRDGFPLSTYPMFASHRGDEVELATAVGTARDGEVVRLAPALLAGTTEPILAVRTATAAVRSDEAPRWCAEVAQRVLDAEDYGEVVGVEVRTERHEVMASVLHGAPPLAVDIHASCRVGRR